MPNQREDGKKQVGFWLSPSEREELEKACELYGLNMTNLVKMAIRKMIIEGDYNNADKTDNNKNRDDINHD